MLDRMKRLLKGVSTERQRAALLAALPADDRALLERIRAARLTYLSEAKLASLAATCRAIEQAGIPGLFVEAGCALGGSAILISTVKKPDRRFQVYDVFGMIPPPTAEDTQDVHERYRTIVAGQSQGIGGDTYYGYLDNIYEVVQGHLAAFGVDVDAQSVVLIKGLLQDTLQLDGPVAFAHVDVDWYEPVTTCLQRIVPRLSVGGSIVLDDYHDWGGCRKATDEFLRGVVGQLELDDSAGSLKLTRVRL